MKIALYGLPCAGKDYLLSNMPFLKHIKGSEWLNQKSEGKFRSLPADKQTELRSEFVEYVSQFGDTDIAVDGHYSFPDGDSFNSVFTESDGNCYDVFVYLDTPIDIIAERIAKSEKNCIYSGLTQEQLQSWRDYETEGLFHEVLKRGKEFILLDNDWNCILEFMEGVTSGSIATAPEVSRIFAERIMSRTNKQTIVLSDGDKTLTQTDLTKDVLDPGERIIKNIFDGDKYTTYQFWKAHKVYAGFEDIENRYEYALSKAEYDIPILKDLSEIDGFKVVVTSGLEELWSLAVERTGVMDMAVGSDVSGRCNMSQLGKAYLARILRQSGLRIVAVGDNMVDYYMLLEANSGYVVAHRKKNESLQKILRNGSVLKQPSGNQIKFEGVKVVSSVHDDS